MSDDALPLRKAGLAFVALLVLTVVAFWPGYVAQPMGSIGGWTHFHAAMGTLWLLMLIVQPMAIHAGRRRLHRIVGRMSYVLMPAVLVSFVGLSHSTMQGKTGMEFAVLAYFFYIRVVLVSIFVVAYAMAIVNRHNPAVHARYMVCTGLALIDPVGHRLAHRFELWMFGSEDFNYQFLTFGLVCVILIALIWMERRARSGRQVFPLMLAAFTVGALPLVFEFYKYHSLWEPWKAFAKSFAELPIP